MKVHFEQKWKKNIRTVIQEVLKWLKYKLSDSKDEI